MRKTFSVLAVVLVTLMLQAAVTKSSTVVSNNITLTAGAADTTTSDVDLTGSYRAHLIIRFTNGATGPTVAPRCDVQTSEDTTAGNYSTLFTVNGDTVNSSVNTRDVWLNDAVEHARLVCGSNTVQNVTLRIVVEKVTGI
jgi:hypothetical protein